MSESTVIAGRAIGEVYRVSRKADIHGFLLAAVEASGGRVIYDSGPNHAPVFLGVQLDSDERIGLLIYPFRVNPRATGGRPADEVRGQLRYGAEDSWTADHPIGRDVAGVDVTLILGADIEDGVFLGLDARLWDPLPMGISFYAKRDEVEQAAQTGWHVWEKENRGGSRRSEPRSPTGLETVVAFKPERLIDYARLERRATSLQLDPPLRFRAAQQFATRESMPEPGARHVLEEQFALTSEQILDIISGRNRLSVAVRGGVAEYHLERYLQQAPGVEHVERLDVDAMHDFNVTLSSGERLRIECKNASPNRFKDGSFKVEVQKTRASKDDPASRFYAIDAFDVVAACLYSPTGRWEFRFGRTSTMEPHKQFTDRLAPIQRVDSNWVDTLSDLP